MTHKIELPEVTVVVLEDEPDGICEKCGMKDELRPYGKRLESGRRMLICYACGLKDVAETDRAIEELFNP
jgi:hypothetical protein